MEKVIREGPVEFGGSSFTTLPNVQGIEQIKNFLWHSQSQSNANKLLCIACSWAQHQTGWHTSIFHDAKTPLPHFESQWLKSMQKYLAKIEAQLEMTEDF
eukprot:8981021-Ditylum_brightwellii.AAC.1